MIRDILELNNIQFINQSNLLDEANNSIGLLINCSYTGQQIEIMHFQENEEIYLVGNSGLYPTTNQVLDQPENMLSLPSALNQIKKHIEYKTLEPA